VPAVRPLHGATEVDTAVHGRGKQQQAKAGPPPCNDHLCPAACSSCLKASAFSAPSTDPAAAHVVDAARHPPPCGALPRGVPTRQYRRRGGGGAAPVVVVLLLLLRTWRSRSGPRPGSPRACRLPDRSITGCPIRRRHQHAASSSPASVAGRVRRGPAAGDARAHGVNRGGLGEIERCRRGAASRQSDQRWRGGWLGSS
jgi:hypothetical protein